MGTLADTIEEYLLRMLSGREAIELCRKELALMFGCAPSQINYVLETRFTAARGFLVESRRGGGGFIRITRLPEWSSYALIGERIDSGSGPDLLSKMIREGIITRDDALLLDETLSQVLAQADFDPDTARLRILRIMLTLLGRRGR